MLLLLGLTLCLAFTVEAALGFGATLLALALGALLLPLEAWLPVVVALNLPLSGWVLGRDARALSWPLLGRALPLMALGFPAGFALLALAPVGAATRLLGAVIVGLAALSLARGAAPPRLGRARGAALLVAGGAVHGLCGCGGPLAVYVTSRELPDPRAFRVTLAALWLVLNLALLGGLALRGALDGGALAPCLPLAPPAALGIALGDWAHRRIPPAPFRRLVLGLLLGAGGLLLVRG